MACHRRQDNWHSYVKNSLDELELQNMTNHLAECPQCQDIVSDIRETTSFLKKNRVVPEADTDLTANIMQRIDLNKYKKDVSPHFLTVKNWGFSLVAAGVILFVLNLTTLTPNFKSNHVAEFNSKIGKELSQPLAKLSLLTHAALGKSEALFRIPTKIEQVIKGGI